MASKSAIAIAELRAQAVAKEMEKKQNMMRLKWFEENYERVYLNPSLPKEKIPKKAAVLLEELRKMRKERFAAEKQLRTKTLAMVEEREEEGDVLDTMYPVPEDVRATLYEGVSHDEEGRYRYLRLRAKEDPHDKYRHKETSGFEYGWRVRETGHPPSKRFCRRGTWHRRANGALSVDDPQRRPPYPSGGVVSMPIL